MQIDFISDDLATSTAKYLHKHPKLQHKRNLSCPKNKIQLDQVFYSNNNKTDNPLSEVSYMDQNPP